MSRASDPAYQPHPWLVGGARALDAGNYRWITEPRPGPAPAARSAAESDLMTIQRVAAEIQRSFACCRFEQVRTRFEEVEELLPAELKTVRGGHTTVEPPPKRPAAWLNRLCWRAACDVWRERREYDLLRNRFGCDGASMKELIAAGFALESVWVTCDPWWPGSSSDDGVESKKLILPWATALRRIDCPTAAQVDAQALRRAGGERAVYAEAMRDLVEHGLRPWAGESAAANRLPVRIPHLRAYEQAVQWVKDQSW